MTEAGGRAGLAPGVALSIALVAAAAFSACHPGPPQIVPPPPTAPRISELQRRINTILAAPDLTRGTWGVLVKSLQNDEALFTLNARKLMMPSSTQKIVTLAVAADQLGWDY